MALKFDVVVIGGGHAGCEAAHCCRQAWRPNSSISCQSRHNWSDALQPSRGWSGKSHLVKEVDALGGVMGIAADATYIQMRTLNASRGPAVQSLRAQSDKRQYSAWMKNFMESLPNLTLRQGMVTKFVFDKGRLTGVELAFGDRIETRAVVLCAGTFLEGTIWIGQETMPAGRAGEFPAVGLSACLKAAGFTMGRLKTGTPPRLDGRTIDYTNLPVVPATPIHNIFLSSRTAPCLSKSHAIRPAQLPKRMRSFAKICTNHRCRSTYEVYLQGCSTSLPVAVQHQIVKSLPGLENAAMVRPAYAVEYDYLPAIQFDHALMSKEMGGFFAAGQMLGTSGYEEAAAQGIIAGINAARYVKDLEPLVLPRSSSYTATLVDDLVTKEILEPYRMMTSRSEYRLLLRQDNADLRLTPVGRSIGLVDDERWAIFEEKIDLIGREKQRLSSTRIHPSAEWDAALSQFDEQLKSAVTLEELLRRPRIPYSVVAERMPPPLGADFPYANEIETEIKYQGYIDRQRNQVAQVEKLDGVRLPKEIVYKSLENLSKEAREKLDRIRPETLGQASRIAGVSPADVSVLLVVLETRRRNLDFGGNGKKARDAALAMAGASNGDDNSSQTAQ
ncbi:unnamed protein product [Sphagnum balticum]